MDQFRRRLLFIAGIAGISGASKTRAQTTDAADLPFCKGQIDRGDWTISQILGKKDNFGLHATLSNLKWEDPNSTHELIDSISLSFSAAAGEIKSGSIIIRVSQPAWFLRPMSALQSGVLQIEFDGSLVTPEETTSKMHFSELAGDDRSSWSATTTIKLGSDMASRLWQAIDRGTNLKVVSLVPSDATIGAGVVTTDFSLHEINKISDIFERVNIDLVQRFEAEQCKVQKLSGGGCYLTTVCCNMIGLPDDCFELRLLRRFRDDWLVQQTRGQAEIAEYEKTAPRIVSTLAASKDGAQKCRIIYIRYILPCIALILIGQRQAAWRHYRRMVFYLRIAMP